VRRGRTEQFCARGAWPAFCVGRSTRTLGITGMTDLHTLQSDSWRVELPADWEETEGAPEGVLYFRSGDKSKAFYICTLLFENDERTVEQILTSIQATEIESNSQMDDSHWKIIAQRKYCDAGVHSWRIDSYDETSSYRIQGKLLAKLPLVVRATFHDYYVEDLNESSRYFEPIISALELT